MYKVMGIAALVATGCHGSGYSSVYNGDGYFNNGGYNNGGGYGGGYNSGGGYNNNGSGYNNGGGNGSGYNNGGYNNGGGNGGGYNNGGGNGGGYNNGGGNNGGYNNYGSNNNGGYNNYGSNNNSGGYNNYGSNNNSGSNNNGGGYNNYGNNNNNGTASGEDGEGRDLVAIEVKHQEAEIVRAGQNFAAKYALASDTGIHIARTLDSWVALGMQRARTDADIADFSKRLYGVSVDQAKNALEKAKKGDPSGIEQTTGEVAHYWGTSPETAKVILKDWFKKDIQALGIRQ